VAIDPDGQILFVRQWRTPAARILLEIPAGTLDIDAATGATEDPELASRRELEEETGYRALTWQRLTSFFTAPGFTSEHMTLYLATDLVAAHPDERLGPDEDEHLRLERRSLADALAAVDSGEIADAKSIIGLLWLARSRDVEARATDGRLDVAPLDPGADDPIAIQRTYQMTVREIVEASILVSQRSRLTQTFGIFLTLIGILPLVTSSNVGGLPALIIGIAMLTGLFAVPFTLFAVWRYRSRVLPEITVTIRPSGIDYRSDSASSTNRWETFARIRESARFLWLELPPQAYVVPNRIFDDEELRQIRRFTAEHGFGPDGRPVAPRGT
jgi:ADP-ribose pyrophosphatase